jgi:hypothetical protein
MRKNSAQGTTSKTKGGQELPPWANFGPHKEEITPFKSQPLKKMANLKEIKKIETWYAPCKSNS